MSVQRYHRWIRAIVEDPKTDIEGIIKHIHKHCGAELDESFANNDMVNWVASTENLLAIAKALLRISVTTKDKIDRLEEKQKTIDTSKVPDFNGSIKPLSKNRTKQ